MFCNFFTANDFLEHTFCVLRIDGFRYKVGACFGTQNVWLRFSEGTIDEEHA